MPDSRHCDSHILIVHSLFIAFNTMTTVSKTSGCIPNMVVPIK